MYILNRFKKFFVGQFSYYSNKTIKEIVQQFELVQQKNNLTQNALKDIVMGINKQSYFDDGKMVTVSLTTYGKRFYEVYLAIESIMQQTVKPNRIILWLADDMKNSEIPILLQNQMKRGLTVDYCKDIKSYKKLIPTINKFPNDIIITIDDDIIYQSDMIENLINAYKADTSKIYCSRMHRISLDKKKQPLPYKKWNWECDDDLISILNFPTSGAGTLYPPHCFHKDILREDLFMTLCPFADDIWFYAMTILNNYYSKKVYTHTPQYVENKVNQDTALNFYNVDYGGNDKQILKVFDYYHIYNLLQQ